MKKLNEKSLRIGDIILTTTPAFNSKAIRLATRSDISHAMIYVEDHSVIDATDEGVQARNTQRLIFDDDSSVHVLRYREGLSSEQVRAICQFARSQVGAEYSVKEAIRTVVGGARSWSKKQFCSRLTAQAFASAGLDLVKDPNFCSPEEIRGSSLLVEVPDATVPVAAGETANWEGRADVPQMMRDAINAVLEGARKRDRNIQSFDDLNLHLVRHPEDDAYICRQFETSGYLTMWKVGMDQNPWQYDLDTMLALSVTEPQIEDYCWNTLSNEETGPNRYVVNRDGYAQLAADFGLRSFHMMRDLYEHLAALHQTRVEVARNWLEAHQLLVPTEDAYLKPSNGS